MPGRSKIYQYIEPGDALAEILFGLIMALTITTGGRLIAGQDGLDVRELALAAVGCNVAWGIIDAVFFILGGLFYRGRRARFFRQLRNARSEEDALAAVRQEFALDEEPLDVPAQDQARLYQSILVMAMHAAPVRIGLSWSDFISALCVFVLVSGTALPAVVPLLLVENAYVALRLSNLVLILLLFLVGYSWAHFTEARPIHVGLTVMLLGIALVAVAVLLGG